VKGLDVQDALARDVLNALSANIAVLDARGTIVAVNEAWIRFARANDAKDEGCYVGADYLAICEQALLRETRRAQSIRDRVIAFQRIFDPTNRTFSKCFGSRPQILRRWTRNTAEVNTNAPGVHAKYSGSECEILRE
jgi:PAS domain-containing protein